ncbi:MAG TPA: sulfotransferase [Solirubrobacteraceae bacterium]|nr:sulfotransferase [Solirubrobacteraceae bacterium]
MQAGKEILDFIVIGAQKAGTTSLFQYLRQHPEIALPEGKEVPYFSHDSLYERGFSAYMGRLVENANREAADPARRWGTVTPQYMVGGVYQPAAGAPERDGYGVRTVPERIRETLPDVRLVAILRDPVQRALSHHRMSATIGRERRSFDEAIDQMLGAEALQDARIHPQESTGYVAWGEYGRILAGYYEVFPSEQILVVFTEELEREPAQLLSRIQAFIGVDPDFQAPNLGERYLVGRVERGFSWGSPSSWMSPSSPLSPQGMQRALRRSSSVRSVWHALPEGPQQLMRGPYERVVRRVEVRNRRSAPAEVKANVQPSAATLERLREHYAQDAERLASLTGLAPVWQSPGGGRGS